MRPSAAALWWIVAGTALCGPAARALPLSAPVLTAAVAAPPQSASPTIGSVTADGPDWADIARYDDGWVRRLSEDGPLPRGLMVQQLDGALEPVRQAEAARRADLDAASAERAGLAGRADRLDAALAAVAAQRFAPTTRLAVSTYLTPGAVSFGGDQSGPYPAGAAASTIPSRSRNAWPAANNAAWGAAVMNYEIHINLQTSFNGRDLLYTRLNSGNANASPFGGNPFNLLLLDKATAPRNGPDSLEVTRLYYRFPINSQITALIGPLARPTHEITALRPWFYGAEPGPPILDFFALNGAPATYNKAAGAALGAQWKQTVPEGRPYWAASASYVAPAADNANTANAASGAGLGGRYSRASLFGQLGIGGPGYVVALAVRQGQCDLNVRRGTQFANQRQPCAPSGSDGTALSRNLALTAAWQPSAAGWIPSINLGWGMSWMQQAAPLPADPAAAFNAAANIAETASWSAALLWRNLWGSGHAAGMAVGQPTYVTRLRDGRTPDDGNLAWEAWTALRLSDHITLTPSLFYLSRPNGQYTAPGRSSNALGTVLVAHFRF
mgnify:CR=1 FL=1